MSALDDGLLSRVLQGASSGLARSACGGLALLPDNGPQMTSHKFKGPLAASGVAHERAGYNNPDGDAYIESFLPALKEEQARLHDYASFAEAIKAIAYCKAEGPHQVFGYRSPQEFRAQQVRSLPEQQAPQVWWQEGSITSGPRPREPSLNRPHLLPRY